MARGEGLPPVRTEDPWSSIRGLERDALSFPSYLGSEVKVKVKENMQKEASGFFRRVEAKAKVGSVSFSGGAPQKQRLRPFYSPWPHSSD